MFATTCHCIVTYSVYELKQKQKMGDFLPKCAFFYEIWVENRPKMHYSSFG